jgi:hypothetical protein
MHMFDGFWSGIIGALLSTRRGGPPGPMAYLLGFALGAVAVEVYFVGSLASDIGLAKALSLVASKFLSPEGIGAPLIGGVMGTSPFWFSGTSGKY